MLNFTKIKIISIYIIFLLLSSFAFLNIISKENSKFLIEDATSAGLDIKSFSDISMLDVFQKNN